MRKLILLLLLSAALLSAGTATVTLDMAGYRIAHATGTPYYPQSGSYADELGGTQINIGYIPPNHYESVITFNTSGYGPVVSANFVWPATGLYVSDYGVDGSACSINGQWYSGSQEPSTFWTPDLMTGTAFSVPYSNSISGSTALSNLGSINTSGNTSIRLQMNCGSYYMIGDGRSRNAYFQWTGSLPRLQITYTTNSTPTLTSLSGLGTNVNYGVYQTVSAAVADADGASNLNFWHVLLSYGVDGAKACYFQLFNRTNQLYLYDGVSSWGAAYTLGSATFAESAYCKVDLSGCSFGGSGANSTVTLKFYLKPGLFVSPQTGTVRSYLYAIDLAGAAVGWAGPYTTTTLRTGPKLVVRSTN